MKKSFAFFNHIFTLLIVLLCSLMFFSCSGGFFNDEAEGSISFVLDRALFDTIIPEEETEIADMSYRVEVFVEGENNFGARQTVYLTPDDFADSKKNPAGFAVEFGKIPARKNYYLFVKIYQEFLHEDIHFSEGDPEPEPLIVGKSDIFKLKAGLNKVTIRAYNYRYDFPFSITITFDELSEKDISALEQDLLITAVAADSEEAKRVAAAGSDKYKIYEALSSSLSV